MKKFIARKLATLFLAASLVPSVGNAASPQAMLLPAPPQVSASSYILMEANSGRIITEQNADEKLPPASLTKMMTAYIVEKELSSGRVSLDSEVPVSVKAWKTGGSRMFIKEGTNVKLEDLLKGVIIQSGNDASVALAEFVAGSEGAFTDIMNQQAKLLGMENTNFQTATGLPRKNQYSSARDLAILASHIINDFPENYPLYAEKSFTYGGIRQPNRNKLLFRDDRIDGLKTGYTERAGYCLVASGKEGETRFIAVVMGAKSPEARAVEAQKLLSYGFRYYKTINLFNAGETIKTKEVWKGIDDRIEVTIKQETPLTVPRDPNAKISADIEIKDVIEAPISEGDKVGDLIIRLNGSEISRSDLVSKTTIEKAGFLKSLWHSIVLLMTALFG